MKLSFRAPWLLALGSAASVGAAPAGPAAPATAAEAVAQGKLSLQARARYEHVDQTNLLEADALTLRTRLGFTTATFRGWRLSAEVENVAAPDGDAYNQAGLNPAAARRAVVADPETTELDQAWLAYTAGGTTVTAGRQRLVLDRARFVGDVGWRQNRQTFDAVTVQRRAAGAPGFTYSYVDRVHRVFSRRHPQGRWRSDSHLLHATHDDFAAGTVTGYAYLLDFAGTAAPNSCATYGVSLEGRRPLSSSLALHYRVEAAVQSDHGASRLNYRTTYAALEAGLATKTLTLTAGGEALGADRGTGFKTPLATLHAFNGWADLFLATPAAGLRDVHVKAAAALPGACALTAAHHWFAADTGGARYGREADVQLTRKFPRGVSAAAKAADFRGAGKLFPDVRKIWIQVEFVY